MKTSAIVFVAAFCTATASPIQAAQQSPVPPKKEQTKEAGIATSYVREGRWEYLVVSFGKALFSEAMDADSKASGLSKVRTLSRAGVLIAQEAVMMQSSMDKLGKFGWELVTVVGAVGGDQELIFKRPYDPDRSNKEAAIVASEARAIKEMEATRLKELLLRAKTEVVDVDALEKEEDEEKVRGEIQEHIEKSLSAVSGFSVKERSVFVVGAPPYATINVVLDGTTELLKEGNKYRKSKALELVSAFAEEVGKACGLTNYEPHGDLDKGHVVLNTSVEVTYSKRSQEVHSASKFYYWLRN